MGFAALKIITYLAFGLLRHECAVPLGPTDKLMGVSLIGLLRREDQLGDR